MLTEPAIYTFALSLISADLETHVTDTRGNNFQAKRTIREGRP
jgi:hypothetical protein